MNPPNANASIWTKQGMIGSRHGSIFHLPAFTSGSSRFKSAIYADMP
ncbi:hypothetical protein DYBT9275_02239 [Dyadobacter sp. CECT 9275]|uniref:Uncharacterized protein n=1 Tax=Dyadobacter helix TaxID=2822344 RepID=A0A916NL82_9BACT|nr:hypothetical protein [Dyadobacter sp. CECT 9275]CAG4999485.1 hypothetical protein DYBT9275_02239 [Dyadobacter sp. CECT 9275]